MIVDLEKYRPERGQSFDVCVVGAGAAGITLAIELARAGKSVVLLESGGRTFEARSQALCLGESAGLKYDGLYFGRARVLGGTTTQWGGQVLEIDRHVFNERPWIAGGQWPFSKSELTAAYARAVTLEGLDGATTSTHAIWSALGLATPELGAHISTAFSRWCPRRDFAVLHARSLTDDPRILVVLHANVCGLLLSANGDAVRGVKAKTLTGRVADYWAGATVLAAGAIETVRILMQATPNGAVPPWNKGGYLGRHFQDHISCEVGSVELRDTSLATLFDYCAIDGYRYHPKLKLSVEAQSRMRTLDMCGTVAFARDGIDDLAMAFETFRLWKLRRWSALTARRLTHLVRHMPELLWHRLPTLRRRAMKPDQIKLRFCIHCEQSPLSDGRITLTESRDRLGMLLPRVEWRSSALEIHSIRDFLHLAQTAFNAAGLGKIVTDPGIEADDGRLVSAFRESYHHIGGTRMANHEYDGVVDRNLRLFGMTNAYVCSTSAYPSAGFANPTHTLVALAVRLAGHLAAQRSA